jgi:heme-degrading monooxygenase HmoA
MIAVDIQITYQSESRDQLLNMVKEMDLMKQAPGFVQFTVAESRKKDAVQDAMRLWIIWESKEAYTNFNNSEAVKAKRAQSGPRKPDFVSEYKVAVLDVLEHV